VSMIFSRRMRFSSAPFERVILPIESIRKGKAR
jgi:hypothetical protein